ncbi:hypothetical protein ACJ73_03570 [Blastomyces percursus]|uniref:Uncharacterized protein n=1 Tax=Blastomyces percursus TaxID=1658174 RepID=A0A1J9Q951_9EURO|nr:hypothetical protein ACJ73_03570 [Blastomyces percursus]
MAPIRKIPLQTRQTHVLPPRPANGPPGEAVPVTSFFRWKTLLWIMIATICIFVLTVYFWKFGAFLRRFTSHRILNGNPESTRYAKTWHGWVPLDEYERKKAWRKEKFKKFRRSVAWRSSHADYNWVWWDPKGAAMEQHFEDQKRIRWLPCWLKSYEHEKAALISKAHAGNQTTRSSDGNIKRKPGLRHSMKISAQVIKSRNRQLRSRLPLYLDGYSDGIIPSMLYNSLSRTSAKRGPYPSLSSRGAVRLRHGMVISPPAVLNQQIPKPDFPHCGLRRCASLSGLPQNLGTVDIRYSPEVRRKTVSEGFQEDAVHSTLSSRLYEPRLRRVIPTDEGQINVGPQAEVTTGKSLSWKYKAWAAKMQIHTFEQSPRYLHGLVGRPGSPLSGILKAMSSSGHHSEFSEHYNDVPAHNHGSGVSVAGISTPVASKLHVLAPRIQRRAPRVHTSDISDASLDIHSVDGSLDVGRSPLTQNINQDNTMRHSCNYNTKHVQRQSLLPHEKAGISLKQPLHPTENKAVTFQLSKPRQNAKNGSWANPRPRLSDYEVELIYDLDRRLEWLSNEVEPGRKPFHFLLLANHWLNRATWIVLDPVSRVSPTERRTHGDPRFNRSLPEPKKDAVKRKYPVQKRVKLHAPRIDSWRLAINGARKSSGIQEFLKAVELFDRSADDPPDAAIDPASWILRKPPQGYERLDKELEVYYEGMCGWWEKLDDWQNVRRAYRARKLVCEGGANRQRMKEVVRNATRPCRIVMKRGRNQGQNAPSKEKQNEEQLSAREIRHARSGSGSTPRRRRCQHGDNPRWPTIAGLTSDTPGNSRFVSISRSAGGFSTRESAHGRSSTGRSFALDGGQESGTDMEALG